MRTHFLSVFSLLLVAGCAAGGTYSTTGDAIRSDEVVECPRGQIAVCVETDCKPENYACTDTDAVRDMLEPGR